MIIGIFICITLFVMLVSGIRRKRMEKSLCRELNLPEATYIRYDMHIVKKLCYTWIGCIVLAVLLFGVLQLMDNLPAGLAAVFICLLYVLIPIGSLTCLLWADGKLYLRELKKNGYLVPEHRKEYRALQALPRLEEASETSGAKDRGFLTFAYISIMLFCIFGFFIVKLFLKWNYANASWLILFIAFLDIIWLFMSFRFYLYSNNRKYRNETLPKLNLKRRPSFFENICLVLLLIGLSVGMIISANSMLRYMTNAKISSDIAFCQEMQKLAQGIYDENTVRRDPEWLDALEQLEDGSDMLSLTETNNLFLQKLLNRSGYSTWEELQEQIRLKDTGIIIRREADGMKLEYQNPHVSEEHKPI